MPLMFRWFQYELRLYYWYQIICMVRGGGEIGDQATLVSLPMELFDWQGTYSAMLKVPFCLAIGNRFHIWSRISWMDEFSDWKRTNPIPCQFIFPVNSSLANNPLQYSSCEMRFIKRIWKISFHPRLLRRLLAIQSWCYIPHLSGGDIKACLASPSILHAVRQGLYFQAHMFVFFPTWLLFAYD